MSAISRHTLKSVPALLWFHVEHLLRREAGKSGKTIESLNDDPGYRKIFDFCKFIMEESTKYTIEEVQQIGNSPTPVSPDMKKIPVVIPMDVCDEAAKKLVEVLGGEKVTRQIVGGIIWWQVRSINGINAQWIPEAPDRDSEYEPDMNKFPCMLYFHGGGYFTGSVDQERYAIEAMALMPALRIFAVSYRLAPQYPFPCAIQDALASYLYLVNPPPDTKHTVNPKQLIISGDSAGGGLALALLQIIRDLDLPKPAGGILISPWCDLTHSFPSIHTNTKTDFIPKYGLSIYKPSSLWPPPPDEHIAKMHSKIRSHVNQTTDRKGRTSLTSHRNRDSRSDSTGHSSPKSSKRISASPVGDGDVTATATGKSGTSSSPRRGQDKETESHASAATFPRSDKANDQTLRVKMEDGEVLEVKDQMHPYAPNTLLVHPLVSPALSYLGGLPPVYVFAGDGEVLRDEIIYSAHKAAYPKRYPVHPEARKMYPKLEGIEDRFKPTWVHLQVYDNAPHVFPILCSFCDSSGPCFRSMWTFIKEVTVPAKMESTSANQPLGREQATKQTGPVSDKATKVNDKPRQATEASASKGSTRSCREPEQPVLLAYSSRLYSRPAEGETSPFQQGTMIRVRVSAKGEIRPLELQSELDACTMPSETIGVVNERVARRYIEGNKKWKGRFSKTEKRIHKKREKKLKNAEIVPSSERRRPEGCSRRVRSRRQDTDSVSTTARTSHHEEVSDLQNMNWAWAWAIGDDECPPPSSIVARLDTKEARQLARIADKPCTDPYRTKLWSRIVCEAKRNGERAKSDKHQVDCDNRRRRSMHDSEDEPVRVVSYGELSKRRIRSTLSLPRSKETIASHA